MKVKIASYMGQRRRLKYKVFSFNYIWQNRRKNIVELWGQNVNVFFDNNDIGATFVSIFY